MPWKQGYTISNERSLSDSDVRWPNGNRCCFSITVDLSVARGPTGIDVADLERPEAFFALNDGLEQVLTVLRKHGFRATFAVPAVIAKIYPSVLRQLVAEGHEIAANGFRHEDVTNL